MKYKDFLNERKATAISGNLIKWELKDKTKLDSDTIEQIVDTTIDIMNTAKGKLTTDELRKKAIKELLANSIISKKDVKDVENALKKRVHDFE
jgi:hypothetical protein